MNQDRLVLGRGWGEGRWYRLGGSAQGPAPSYLICHTSRSAITEQRKGFQFLPEIGERWEEMVILQRCPGSHQLGLQRSPSQAGGVCGASPSSLPPGLQGVTCPVSLSPIWGFSSCNHDQGRGLLGTHFCGCPAQSQTLSPCDPPMSPLLLLLLFTC